MLQIDGLNKIFANTTDEIAGGIRDANFKLESGSFFTLLGPSGCGKTTTLRCLAGLEKPDSGRISLFDNVLFDADNNVNVAMNLREIGMVFQSYAIWPHMTVAENVAFPLTVAKDRKYSKSEIAELVKQALATVSLDGYQTRPAPRLSGGEQQRVALARAIVRQPKLLLLDEPLSNLDAQLREEMRVELKRLQRQIGITTVYVTHDQSEALAMSDRIAVIKNGRIMQLDDPRAIYFRPVNEFVARFVGATNLLAGQITAQEGDRAHVQILGGQTVQCLVPNAIADKTRMSVSIRPERIHATGDGPPPTDGVNVLKGKIVAVAFLGYTSRVDVAVGDTILQSTADSMADLPSDGEITLTFRIEDTIAVPPAP